MHVSLSQITLRLTVCTDAPLATLTPNDATGGRLRIVGPDLDAALGQRAIMQARGQSREIVEESVETASIAPGSGRAQAKLAMQLAGRKQGQINRRNYVVLWEARGHEPLACRSQLLLRPLLHPNHRLSHSVG